MVFAAGCANSRAIFQPSTPESPATVDTYQASRPRFGEGLRRMGRRIVPPREEPPAEVIVPESDDEIPVIRLGPDDVTPPSSSRGRARVSFFDPRR